MSCKNGPGKRKWDALGGNHFGPVMVYLCEVTDAKTASGDCSWVKVAQDTYAGTTESWGTEILNDNCGKKDIKIPAGFKNGQYLIRIEALALHTAGSEGGAQFYISCGQLGVQGGGSKSLPAGVKIPGAYSSKDPGIKVNIYGEPFNVHGGGAKKGGDTSKMYIAPGPPVWSGQ